MATFAANERQNGSLMVINLELPKKELIPNRFEDKLVYTPFER